MLPVTVQIFIAESLFLEDSRIHRMQIPLLDDAVLEVPAQTFVNLLKDRPVRKTFPCVILQMELVQFKIAQGGIVRLRSIQL